MKSNEIMIIILTAFLLFYAGITMLGEKLDNVVKQTEHMERSLEYSNTSIYVLSYCGGESSCVNEVNDCINEYNNNLSGFHFTEALVTCITNKDSQ